MSASDLNPYRAIFANATDGIALINPNGRYIEQNLAHRAILGYSDEELIGQTPAIHVGEEVFQRIAQELIDTGRFQGEVRSRRKDGRWVDIALSAFGIYDHKGEVLCYVGMKRDITGRKHAEEALRTAHDTFRHLVEQSPFGVYAIDADFRLVQVSAGAQKVFQNVRPLLGRDFAEVLRQIWPEPFAGEAIARFRHTLETGEPYRSPQTVERRRDIGEVESYDWKIERVTLPDGRWGVVCHFYDLSERQRYEEALRESEERFRNMADHAPVMVWVTDPTGACTFLNQTWYDFTGQTPETGQGYGWLEAVHERDRASVKQVFLEANATHSAFRADYRLRRRDGQYRWVIDAASPRFSAEGCFLGYIGSVIDITERKQVEQVLAANEERYRHIFESAGVSLFEEDWSEIQRWFDDLRSEGVTDLAGYLDANPEKVAASIPMIRVTDVNEYAVRLFQAPSKTALLGKLGRVFTPETTAVFREELIAFWKGLDLLEQPSRLRTLKGEPLSVLCSVKVPRHRADWDRVLVAVTDVTALREAERAVRENEERFRTLADNMSQFAWMADEKGWLFWYNRRWFEYTGTNLEQMQGWGWKAVHHPDHLQRVMETWQAALEAGAAWEDTFPLRGRDGRYRWFLSRAVPIRDADGRILRWFGTNTDITELREAEQAQARLAAIVTSSDDAIISTDLNGIITSWNRGADRLYGYTEQEAVGRPITFLMPYERMDEEPEILSRIRKGASVEHYETTRRRKDGTLLDISLTVSPIKDEDGRIIGASKVARDISERKRQEEELRRWKDELEVRVRERTSELLATQGRLMTVTSQLSLTEQRERRKLARDLHDYLAQLLAVGQMKTGMLKKQLPHNPASAALLQDLDKVFQQALVYTRTLIAELSPPSLEDSGLPAALKWLAERFEKDGLRVDVQADGASIPLAEEQAVVVFQAVRELLFNVMKHAGVGGATVTVTLNEDGFLRVAVADRGKGFSSDALQRSAQPGHLGLVSVRERFRAMGGRVDVESRPGQGTTVTLCLPLGEGVKGKTLGVMGTSDRPVAEDRTIGSNPNIASRLTPGASRIRVLLVDDHKLVRQGLRDLLAADERIRVVGEAGTCEEALLLAANVAPDVVVTDINLPGVNGIEMTKRFKTLHPQMTVIGLSAHTEEHLKQDLLSAGAETLLSKEYAADELIPTIIQYHDRQVAGR
jgi:PAS domain S-box-containing protein